MISRALVQRTMALATALTLGMTGAVVTGAGPAAADRCTDVRIIGIPGTNQGVQHGYGGNDERIRTMGGQVAAAVVALREKLSGKSISEFAVDYRATGVDDGQWFDTKFRFNQSEYRTSRDEGNAAAFGELKSTVADCGDRTKIYLVGYSQGAHIAGDLVQRISKESIPVSPDRLGGAVLLADPAFHSDDARSSKVLAMTADRDARERGPSAVKGITDVGFDHGTFHGTLGDRGEYGDNVRVVSTCVLGDPICTTNVSTAIFAQWIHTETYTPEYPFGGFSSGAKSVAAWTVEKLPS